MKRKPFGWCVSLVAMAVISLSASRVAAQTKYFTQTSGYWTNSAHWNLPGVPSSTTNAQIGTTSGLGKTPATCILDTAGQQCNALYLGVAAGQRGELIVTNGGSLTASTKIQIGLSGTGIVNQSSGTWNNGGIVLTLGENAGSHGEYTISGGSLTNMNGILIGNKGSGTLNISGSAELRGFTGTGYTYVGDDANLGRGVINQTGGTWDNSGRRLYLGNGAGTYGEYNITGGAIANSDNVFIGNEGSGVLNLGGDGTFQVNVRLYLAYSAGSTGVVNQTGGVCMGDAVDGCYFIVGWNGYAEYNISGDSILTNSWILEVGRTSSSSTGLLSITGSSASIHTDRFLCQETNSTLRFAPDSAGVSPINVVDGPFYDGRVYLGNGTSTLVVDFSTYNSTNPLTIIKHDGALYGAFAVTNVLPEGWSADISYATAHEVRLVNITSPPKGTVVSIR